MVYIYRLGGWVGGKGMAPPTKVLKAVRAAERMADAQGKTHFSLSVRALKDREGWERAEAAGGLEANQ